MAKIFKVTGYFVDCNDEYDCDRLKVDLEQDYDLIAHHINIEERDIGEWDDDNPLNSFDCPKSECEKYFINESFCQPIKYVCDDFKTEADDEGNITITGRPSPSEIAELFDVPIADVLSGNLKLGIIYEKE